MSEFFREVVDHELGRGTDFVIRAGDLENGLPNDFLMGVCSVDNGHARSWYTKQDGLMRLSAKVGIDSYADGCEFSDWWNAYGAVCQRAWANVRKGCGYYSSFADFVQEAFLDWLEPVSEDDRNLNEEYNDNYPQEWFCLGDDRAARVCLRWRERDEQEEDFFPLRLEYTAGDYPTFRQFDTFEDANQEVLRWIKS